MEVHSAIHFLDNLGWGGGGVIFGVGLNCTLVWSQTP